MFDVLSAAPGRRFWLSIPIALIAITLALPGQLVAQPPAGADAGPATFVPAIELLPDNVAGLVRIPDVPKFCDATKQTRVGQMMADPAMQPFIDAQRDRAKDYLQSFNNKIGVTLEDLYDIASGEVVFGWIPFEKDKRRPHALSVMADTRGRAKDTADAMEKVDADLKAGGWTRSNVTHRGREVRVYNFKPKPGQLKIEQIAIHIGKDRLIAADRDTVVTDLIDALDGKGNGSPISQSEDFRTVLTRSAKELKPAAQAGGGSLAVEWFARPLAIGRILRQAFDIDRGNDVKILDLLERQGFDAIRAAGGILLINGDKYDVLHKAYVLAPPTVPGEQRYEKAAQMLQFPNDELQPIPRWIPENASAFNRLRMKIENAFWASESLVNDAVKDDIFRSMIDGIKEDEDGPQIDIENEILPNLADEVILVTDHVVPIDLGCQRLLVALKVRDAKVIGDSVRRVMESEPDARRIDADGTEIYQVQRGEDELDDLDDELFGDFEDEDAEAAQKPLLDQWAIALIDQGPGSDGAYLMFSSHVDFLVETSKRIAQGKESGLKALDEIETLRKSIIELDGDQLAFERVTRTRLSMRAKYELLRAGKLKESDSILSSLYRRIAEDSETGEIDPLGASKLPPIAKIESYLPNGGSFFRSTDDGWVITGFFLK